MAAHHESAPSLGSFRDIGRLEARVVAQFELAWRPFPEATWHERVKLSHYRGAVSYFAPLAGGESFLVEMPEDALAFLRTQPEHRDPTSDGGWSSSAYFEVVGTLSSLPANPFDPNGRPPPKKLRVDRVLRMSAANADYIAAFKPRSIGHPLP